MFQDMLGRLREGVTQLLCHLEIQMQAPEAIPTPTGPTSMSEQHAELDAFADAGEAAAGGGAQSARPQPARRIATPAIDPNDPATWGKVPRNSACPCGSGKKYKHCHGKLA